MTISKAEQRVAIAEDIIERLDYLKISTMHYLTPRKAVKWRGKDLKKYLPEIEENCTVCALGAAMLSYIRLYDKITVKKMRDTINIDIGLLKAPRNKDGNEAHILVSEVLLKAFDIDQLALIEAAFEKGNSACLNAYNKNHEALYVNLDRADEFGRNYYNSKDRLRAICVNIINNDGLFKP